MATKILKKSRNVLVAMLNGVHHLSAGLTYLHSCKHGLGILSHPSLPALQPNATNGFPMILAIALFYEQRIA